MQRFHNIIIKELFYGGLSREDFRQVSEPVGERNRKTVIIWSVGSVLFYLIALFLYRAQEKPLGIPIFLATLITSIITMTCTLLISSRHPRANRLAMHLLEFSLLGNAVALSVFHSPLRDCGTFVIAALLPSVFIDRTVVQIAFAALAIVAYIVIGECGLITPDIYSWGLLSLSFYSFVALLNGHFINKSRFERFLYADSAKKLADMEKNYNEELQKEVAQKTDRIIALNDQLMIGMATMVESRDNSTGGHIRRTSAVVRMLTDAIRESGDLQLTDQFCENIIKAAPMHDLGKIAVNDAILRKPGRFTPEEYEAMKTHAAEGARIVHEILADSDDEELRRIAENMAHYHHERMDGSGYPDKLKGGEIPLEARVMAIADVYDALVSERVYKESYSFEKANQIILEGMGTQFDPKLKKYYEAARPKLEAYYAMDRDTNETDRVQ